MKRNYIGYFVIIILICLHYIKVKSLESSVVKLTYERDCYYQYIYNALGKKTAEKVKIYYAIDDKMYKTFTRFLMNEEIKGGKNAF